MDPAEVGDVPRHRLEVGERRGAAIGAADRQAPSGGVGCDDGAEAPDVDIGRAVVGLGA